MYTYLKPTEWSKYGIERYIETDKLEEPIITSMEKKKAYCNKCRRFTMELDTDSNNNVLLRCMLCDTEKYDVIFKDLELDLDTEELQHTDNMNIIPPITSIYNTVHVLIDEVQSIYEKYSIRIDGPSILLTVEGKYMSIESEDTLEIRPLRYTYNFNTRKGRVDLTILKKDGEVSNVKDILFKSIKDTLPAYTHKAVLNFEDISDIYSTLNILIQRNILKNTELKEISKNTEKLDIK